MSEPAAEILNHLSARLRAFFDALDEAEQKAIQRADAMKEPFIGKEEAAEFLNMSVTTLERRMAERSGPPRYTDGGKVNFRRSELVRWRRKWRAGDQAGLEEQSIG